MQAPINPAIKPNNPPAKPIQMGNVKIRSKTINTVELEDELRVDIVLFSQQESFNFVDVGNLTQILILTKKFVPHCINLNSWIYKSEH